MLLNQEEVSYFCITFFKEIPNSWEEVGISIFDSGNFSGDEELVGIFSRADWNWIYFKELWKENFVSRKGIIFNKVLRTDDNLD